MHNQSSVNCISSDKKYVVDGKSLLSMNGAYEKVMSNLNWLKTSMTDGMSSLASGGDDCFVKFVARTCLDLKTVVGTISLIRANGLKSPGLYRLELEELCRDKVSGENSGGVCRNCNRFETADEAWSYWKNLVATSDDNKVKNEEFNRWLFDEYRRPESAAEA